MDRSIDRRVIAWTHGANKAKCIKCDDPGCVTTFEDTWRSANENIIFFCAHLFVSLAPPKILGVRQTKILFSFALTYSYHWLRRRYSAFGKRKYYFLLRSLIRITGSAEDTRRSANENIIFFCAHLFVSLAPPKILGVRQTKILFSFALTYSYL